MTNNFSNLSFKRVTGMFLAVLMLSFVLIVGSALAMPPQQTFDLDGVDWIEVAAQTIGMDGETLYNETDAGKSVAELAQANGVDSQTVIDAIVAAETEAIKQEVTDGVLSQEEADAWLKLLPEDVKLFVETVYEGGDENEENQMSGADWVEVAAQTIGLESDALYNEVEGGKTVAVVTQEKGVDIQKVIDAVVTAETEAIKQDVTNGVLSQEEADAWLQLLPEDVKTFVEDTNAALSLELSEGDGVDSYTVAAQVIGVDVTVIDDALTNGKSIAAVAQEKGVDTQTVIDAIVAHETELVNQVVTDGDLTQEDVDSWLKSLPEDVKLFVENGYDEGGDEDGKNQMSNTDWFEVAATAIGIESDALYKDVEGGKSVAEIAQANGVDNQTVIDALVAAETEASKKDVADGIITQEEADGWLKFLPEDAKLFVESNDETDVDLIFENELSSDDWFSVAAQAIGIEGNALFSEAMAGKSVAEVAQAKGVDSQTVIDAIVAAETEAIKKEVADGIVSQEEADGWLKTLPEDVKAFVESNGEEVVE